MNSWQEIHNLDSIDSTNNYFSKLLKEKKHPEGSIITTLYQESGKGQGKNTWESEKGKNLLFSINLYPEFLPIDKNFLLSKAISLGIVEYLNTKTSKVKIKWPNDIYVGNKKIAGILIENTIKGSDINQSIIGIGLNINQINFKSDAPNPISLCKISGEIYSLETELLNLRNSIQTFYKKLEEGKYEFINELYIKYLYRYNEMCSYISYKTSFEAKIKGVNEYGYLQIEKSNGENLEFDFKEIEFII